MTPATEAGREFHAGLHEPGGVYEQVTGRSECGSLGCGSLASILAIEQEAVRTYKERLAAGVEELPRFPRRAGPWVARAAVLRLIEDTK